MSYKVVNVHLLSMPFHADKAYSYYVPFGFFGEIIRGNLVVVPFGGANKRLTALVTAVSDTNDIENLKPILSVNDYVKLTSEEVDLSEFIAKYSFCSIGEAVKAILPPGILTDVTCVYKLSEIAVEEPISEDAYRIMNLLYKRGELTDEQLVKTAGIAAYSALAELVGKGIIIKEEKHKRPTNTKQKEIVDIAVDDNELSAHKLRGIKQIEIINYLKEYGSSDFEDIKKILNVTKSHLKPLIEKGLINVTTEVVYRGLQTTKATKEKDTLTEHQAQAFDKISKLLDENKAHAVLLHGITGSGKTSVIMAAMDKVLNMGKQVILLVPEIALTPQTLNRFCSIYGNRIALCHSALSDGERYDAYQRMKNGEADICIGTRSAIFAPFNNIGLIVIDEEHEHTYKSEQTPKYNAKEVASYRCGKHGAMMLLASATPSIESYYKAKKGIYTLVELTQRYGNAILPETTIVDLRVESKNGNISPIGRVLESKINSVLDNQEQSILFINRRGYSNFLTCTLCGSAISCPHCSVALTHHAPKISSRNTENKLMCHYCGFSMPIPEKCPECGNSKMSYVGYGTQKAEDAVLNTFNNASVLRLDADSAGSKYNLQEILDKFRNREANVLIGTQMVTKGHDFPSVTLVGILLADASLFSDDYRANERTFSLITQVIGRAGRADKKGIALIQTYNPEHPVILKAASQDYVSFYNDEIQVRQTLVFPPFCDLALLSFSSEDEAALCNACVNFAGYLKQLLSEKYTDVNIYIYGPFDAPIYKINEQYRKRFIAKCKMNSRSRQFFTEALMEFTKKIGRKVSISIDINPNNI